MTGLRTKTVKLEAEVTLTKRGLTVTRDAQTIVQKEPPFADLWRRQCARNIMDCYALGMEASLETKTGRKETETLTRLMVEGMTAVRNEEDEHVFYSSAARSCRDCAKALEGTEKARLFRIYAAIFEDMHSTVS